MYSNILPITGALAEGTRIMPKAFITSINMTSQRVVLFVIVGALICYAQIVNFLKKRKEDQYDEKVKDALHYASIEFSRKVTKETAEKEAKEARESAERVRIEKEITKEALLMPNNKPLPQRIEEVRIEMREIEDICNDNYCLVEDAIKLSREEFNNLFDYTHAKHNVYLKDFCEITSRGNVIFSGKKEIEAYYKSVLFMEHSEDPSSFLYGKKYSDVLFFNSNDKEFEIANSIGGMPIKKGKVNAILIDKKKFHEFMEEKELKDFCNKHNCKPEKLVRISPDKFDELYEYMKDEHNIELKEYCKITSRKNAIFHKEKNIATYFKSVLLMKHGQEYRNFFYKKRFSDLVYIDESNTLLDKSNPLFKDIQSIGVHINNDENGAMIIDKRKFRRLMRNISESFYSDEADVTSMSKLSFKLMKSRIKMHKSITKMEKCFVLRVPLSEVDVSEFDCFKVIGRTESDVHVAHKINAIDKFITSKLDALDDELDDICDTTNCKRSKIIKLSPKEFNELASYAKDIHGIKLENYCKEGLEGNFFFFEESGFEAFFKLNTLKNIKDPKDPLFNKKYSDVMYFNKSNPIFNAVWDLGQVISTKKKIRCALVEKSKFINHVKEITVEARGEGAVLSNFVKSDFDKIAAKIEEMREESFQQQQLENQRILKEAIALKALKETARREEFEAAKKAGNIDASEEYKEDEEEIDVEGIISKIDLSEFDCYTVIGQLKSVVCVAHQPGALDKYIAETKGLFKMERDIH